MGPKKENELVESANNKQEDDEDEESMEVETREPKKEWPVEVKRRPDVLYLHGTDRMSTEDVFRYFDYSKALFVEWINDSSCNVVFDSHSSAVQAFTETATQAAEGDSPTGLPPGESPVLYEWRYGKPWRRNTLQLRFATIEDRRPVVPKKSAYFEDLLRNKQKEAKQSHGLSATGSKRGKVSKQKSRRGKRSHSGKSKKTKKEVISTAGLDEACEELHHKRQLKFAMALHYTSRGSTAGSLPEQEDEQQLI